MNFENPLFNFAILISPVFIIAGIILYKFPPKKINHLYGYRTKRSMKNQEVWDFSQKYSAKVMTVLGFLYFIILLILSNFTFPESTVLIIGLGLMIVLSLGIFIIVEKKLKQKFQ